MAGRPEILFPLFADVQTLPGVASNPQGYGAYARRNLSASEAAILMHEAA